MNVIARRDEGGKVISYQGIVHNITEAVRHKELESIGMLAGCFADDLASPLSVTMMGISATGHFLADLKMDIDRLSDPEKDGNPGEIVEGETYRGFSWASFQGFGVQGFRVQERSNLRAQMS